MIGGGPEGGMPEGGGMGFQQTPNAQMATAIAGRRGNGDMFTARLLEPLIALLEKRAAE